MCRRPSSLSSVSAGAGPPGRQGVLWPPSPRRPRFSGRFPPPLPPLLPPPSPGRRAAPRHGEAIRRHPPLCRDIPSLLAAAGWLGIPGRQAARGGRAPEATLPSPVRRGLAAYRPPHRAGRCWCLALLSSRGGAGPGPAGLTVVLFSSRLTRRSRSNASLRRSRSRTGLSRSGFA